jgi:hypothetical protein
MPEKQAESVILPLFDEAADWLMRPWEIATDRETVPLVFQGFSGPLADQIL